MLARRALHCTAVSGLLIITGLGTIHPRPAAAALDCSQYTTLRVTRFRAAAERVVEACLRRSARKGIICPDEKLTTRLAALHAAAVKALERRCPGGNGEGKISAEQEDVLCDLLAICPSPTPTPPQPTPSRFGAVTLRVLASSAGGAATALARGAATRTLRVDAGWTALTHDLGVLEGADVTAELDNCDGVTDTICDIHGATTGVSFGAPSPVSGGGIATCMTVEFGSDLTGTLDLATGDLTETAQLHIEYYRGFSIYAPCSACLVADGDPELGEAGTCESGPAFGQPCTVEGLGDVGYGGERGTSTQCPPDPAKLIGDFRSVVTATTGQSTLAVTAASPPCSYSNLGQCPCATCNTAEQIACSSNADCPVSGGAPGICGGRRCVSGTMNGTPCASSTECDSGLCTRTGEPTKRDACLYMEDEDPTGCQPVSEGYGVCVSGPLDTVCEVQHHRGCIQDADCQPPSGVIPGDRCIVRNRGCFLDPIVTTGTPDPPAGGVAHPVLAGSFCMGPSVRAAHNDVTGLPGPVRFLWPSELTLEN
jgi:hypothetical protein